MPASRKHILTWLVSALLIGAAWFGISADSFGASSSATPVPACAISGIPASRRVEVESMGCYAAGAGTPQAAEGLTVTLYLSSDRAAPQDIVVDVRAADGAPVDNATVILINRHLEMEHGEFVRVLVHARDGRYMGDKVGMGMGGRWQTEIQISRSGEATVAFFFEVTLKGIGE